MQQLGLRVIILLISNLDASLKTKAIVVIAIFSSICATLTANK